jgi:hypothetical protein
MVALSAMSPSAERQCKGLRESEGAGPALDRGAAAAPRCDLRRPTVSTKLRELGLSSNQVWGLTKTDQEWSAALGEALLATRRADLQHGTNAAYVHGWVCSECREHQRRRMASLRLDN